MAAAPRPSPQDARSAQTHRTASAAVASLAAFPTAAAARAPRGTRAWAAVGGAAAGITLLAIGWLLLRGRPATPPASGSPSPVAAKTGSDSARLAPPASAASGGTAAARERNAVGADAGAHVREAVRLPDAAATRGSGASVPHDRVAPAPLASGGAAALPGAPLPVAPRGDAPSGATAAAGAAVGGVAGGPPPAAPAPAASRDDARKVGRDFVTLLNQRRYRDLAQIAAVGGDAAARAELLRLAESAPDFSAGFDRLPSNPESWSRGFVTEFDVDLQYRGGSRLMRVRVYAAPADGGGWRIAGVGVEAVP